MVFTCSCGYTRSYGLPDNNRPKQVTRTRGRNDLKYGWGCETDNSDNQTGDFLRFVEENFFISGIVFSVRKYWRLKRLKIILWQVCTTYGPQLLIWPAKPVLLIFFLSLIITPFECVIVYQLWPLDKSKKNFRPPGDLSSAPLFYGDQSNSKSLIHWGLGIRTSTVTGTLLHDSLSVRFHLSVLISNGHSTICNSIRTPLHD